jgi:alkylation response protein AidB-like acyl-CoA dehydrogenase
VTTASVALSRRYRGDVAADALLSASERAWQGEVRSFLLETVTLELEREVLRDGEMIHGPEVRRFRQAVGTRGWFGVTWPAEFGGLERTPIEQHILMDEFAYARVPALDLTVASIAPIIMRFGTESNQRDWLPGIADGSITFAVAYSEPEAGTDLASLRTRATRDGDVWVIDGVKAWNSAAGFATHQWVLARSDPTSVGRRGLSLFVVPMTAPGIHVSRVETWAEPTHETTFRDVRISERNLIGAEGEGWAYVMGALDLERGVIGNAGDLRRAVDDLIDHCTRADADGRRPADDPLVAARVAELDADVEIARLLCQRSASVLAGGVIPTIVATEAKIFGSELRQQVADVGLGILGVSGLQSFAEPGAPLGGIFERLYRFAPVQRFAGGTNEVLRDVIAQRGLGMPPYGRRRTAP